LYLSQEDVIKCSGLSVEDAMQSVERVFSLHDRGECIEPDGSLIRWSNGSGRWMSAHPAYVGADIRMAGIKWIACSPENRVRSNLPSSSALIILNDGDTGVPLAVMDGGAISAIRTGAVTAVGAKYLACPDARVVGVIGAGVISRAQLLALHATLGKLRLVKLFSRTAAKAHAFASEMSEQLGLEIRVVDCAEAAVRNSDVVAPATNIIQKVRYIQPGWIKPGAYVVNTSGNDYSVNAVLSCNMIVVDDKKQLAVPNLTLSDMCKDGLVAPDDLVELGSIINGRRPARGRENDRIFFSPFGMGIADLIIAHRVYKEAQRRGVGQYLCLWREPLWGQ